MHSWPKLNSLSLGRFEWKFRLLIFVQLPWWKRRAAHFIKGDFRTIASVTKMLQDLGLKDLKDRHRDLRLALLFKVVQGHVGVSPEDIGLEPADGRTRANHKHKFRTRGARTNSYKYSFASRTISEWNRLPANIVEADSPQAFKAGLVTLAPVAPEMPWSGTHPSALYTTGWPADNRPRQDKTSLDFTEDKSTLVQVMAWCHQATSHYLSQCWPRFLSPYSVTRPQWVKQWLNHIFTPFEMECNDA